MPLLLPNVEIGTIGAGGGSLARVEPGGALAVGPESAGAVPGPVSYLRGGTVPTFTDGALASGLIGSSRFLDGAMSLDESAAAAAIEEQIGRPLGLATEEAAAGIVRIVEANMAALLESITIENGVDPRDYVLYAYGGGGPLVAASLAHELGIGTVVVPPYPGVFSAWGMLTLEIVHDFVDALFLPLDELTADGLGAKAGGARRRRARRPHPRARGRGAAALRARGRHALLRPGAHAFRAAPLAAGRRLARGGAPRCVHRAASPDLRLRARRERRARLAAAPGRRVARSPRGARDVDAARALRRRAARPVGERGVWHRESGGSRSLPGLAPRSAARGPLARRAGDRRGVDGHDLRPSGLAARGRRRAEPCSHGAQRTGRVMSVLIKGGTVVTSTGSYEADVSIAGERIEAIAPGLETPADRVIDATGKLVLPGGIDGHTHMESEAFGTVTADDFTSGTVAALFGGTTTIVDMAAQYPGFGLEESVARWHEKVERCPPVVDVGFHLILTDLDDGAAGRTFDDVRRLPSLGITSVKVFLAYKGAVMVDDETLFRLMQQAAQENLLVLVHAENGHVVQVLTEQLLAQGRTEPRWHAASRPELVEAEATARAIAFARLTGAPLYIVHVSCEEAAEPIASARAKGWRVVGETCPQYLFTDATALDTPDFSAAKFVFTPPPRPAANQAVLWDALRDDTLSVVSSDHSTWNFETQKQLGRDDFSLIPNGAPGVEERLMLLYDGGVRTGRISASRFVDLVSTTPARLFGLYPRKGELAPGSDADVVIWDPGRRTTLSVETQHSKTDYNLFEGRTVIGGPSVVLVRGAVAVEDGRLLVEPGHGRFLERGATQL